MRIIAGTHGGRRLTAVPGTTTRPTADRVREALFSRLASRYRLVGVEILDLFAGTGALGIEALSRGAGAIVSVEKDRRAARVLIANLKTCGLDGRAEVLVGDVESSVVKLGRSGRRFAGVFVDPPYGRGLAGTTLEGLGRSGILIEGAWVSVEVASDEALPEHAGRLIRVREDRYGDTKLVLYEIQETERWGSEG